MLVFKVIIKVFRKSRLLQKLTLQKCTITFVLCQNVKYVCSDEDAELQLALQLSQSLLPSEESLLPPGVPSCSDPVQDQSRITSEEDAIQQAIQMSLTEEKQKKAEAEQRPKWGRGDTTVNNSS